MIDLFVRNETDPLEVVVLGIADSFGDTPEMADAYDPKSKEFIARGAFPKEEDLKREMEAFRLVFEKYQVEVLRPSFIANYNQIFSRDIAFVIDDKLVLPNIIEDRKKERDALKAILDKIDPSNQIHMPTGSQAEGGDVMPWNEFLFVGYSEPEDFERFIVARTNVDGLNFLKKEFPNREVHGFELVKSDTDPRENALHLDCCFQPIGKNQAILYPGGFKYEEDVEFLISLFGSENIIEIEKEEMYMMCSNIFSISPEVIVSERNFKRLNNELRHRGFTVEEVPYYEISKMEGLLRCTTMPLRRNPA